MRDWGWAGFPTMRLDHISYAAPSDHLADVVQRIGYRLGAGFSDGGVHPRFGTRNFVLPLAGGRAISRSSQRSTIPPPRLRRLDVPSSSALPTAAAGWAGSLRGSRNGTHREPARPGVGSRARRAARRLRPAMATDCASTSSSTTRSCRSSYDGVVRTGAAPRGSATEPRFAS